LKKAFSKGDSENHILLHIDCPFGITRPTQVSLSGVFYLLGLYPTDGFAGFGVLPAVKDTNGEISWPLQDRNSFEARTCIITNYGSNPIIDLTMKLTINFYSAVPTGNGFSLGNKICSKEWPITFPKIDNGNNNAFKFYIYNSSKNFVSIQFPKTCNAHQLKNGSTGKIIIKTVGPDDNQIIWFVPETDRKIADKQSLPPPTAVLASQQRANGAPKMSALSRLLYRNSNSAT
jgi:hypothetical protein